ncbi:MAG: M28 family peptidase [Thermoplasmata archaeon]
MKKAIVALLLAIVMSITAAAPFALGAPTMGTGSSSGLTPEEARVLKGLDYDHAWHQLEYLSSLGEKTAGSDEEKSAQMYMRDQFSQMAVDEVWWETFPVANWKHYGTTVKIVSNGYEDVPATVYGDTLSIWGRTDKKPYYFGNTNEGKTLVADVVDVGFGTKAEFEAVGDLRGAIALVHRDDNIQGWPNTPAIEAALHGASAAMFYGYYDGYDHPDGIKQDSVFSPIPTVSISPRSAWHIQDLLSKGPVTLQIEGRVDTLSEKFAESVNVAAVMWGATRPDEYVVVSGHIDTWWQGSNDDCSAVSVVLELARLFSEARAAGTFVNDRTLVFCSVGSEETGGPGGTWYNWLVGSYEFVVAHPEIMNGLAVELNLDGVSFTRASGRYWIENTWETNGIVSSAVSDLGVNGMVSWYNPIWSWTDAWSFGAKGGGSAIQSMWMTGFDEYYHTQLDTIELQGHELLDLVLKLYALMAMRVDHALVLPLDFTYTCDWAAGRLKSEKMTMPSEAKTIDKAAAALSALRAQAVSMNAYAQKLRDMYASAATPEERAKIWELANALNRAIIDARRIITPYTLGEGGLMGSWDVFLRPDQHVHDFGYVNSAIVALSKGQTGNAIAALGNVYTMEWGKYYSRETYLEVLSSMVDCYMYWGDDFDQQQAYVDVQGIYLGLKDGSMSKSAALASLKSIGDGQLIPWFQEDIKTLEWAWLASSGVLDAATP